MTTASPALDLLRNVEVRLSVELGRAQLKLKDVLALEPESVVPLDRQTDELLDILVNGQPIGKAEIVAEGGRFAMRIVTLAEEGGALGTLSGDRAAA